MQRVKRNGRAIVQLRYKKVIFFFFFFLRRRTEIFFRMILFRMNIFCQQKWDLQTLVAILLSARRFPSLRLGSRQFITHTRAQQVARLPCAFNLSNAVHWTDKRFRSKE